MKIFKAFATIIVLYSLTETACSQSYRLSGSFGQIREIGKVVENDLIKENRDPTFSFSVSGQYLLPKNRFLMIGWQNLGFGVPFTNSLGVPSSLLGRVNRVNLYEIGFGFDTEKFNRRDNFRLQSSIQLLVNNIEEVSSSTFGPINLTVTRSNSMVPILSNEITFVHQAFRRIQTKVSAKINLSLSELSKNSFEVDQAFRPVVFSSRTTGSSLLLEYGFLYAFGHGKNK